MKNIAYTIIGFIFIFSSCKKDESTSENSTATNGIVISTTSVNGITNNTVVGGGNISNDGGSAIIERGVCYSINSNPTIKNTRTSDGNSIGVFSSTLSGLFSGTNYYARAYAINSKGVVYGNQVTFNTTGASAMIGCSGGPTTITDIDGNIYNVISIGGKCWTKENLKTTKYRNGDNISTNLSDADWSNATSGAFAINSNDMANESKYGKLYNYYAVADSRGLCPTGWHVPSNSEFNLLLKGIDPQADTSCVNMCIISQTAADALKEIGITHWANAGNSTNSSGFTGLPGGYRYKDGTYNNSSIYAYWWSSTRFSTTDCLPLTVAAFASYVPIGPDDQHSGYSVRCIAD